MAMASVIEKKHNNVQPWNDLEPLSQQEKSIGDEIDRQTPCPYAYTSMSPCFRNVPKGYCDFSSGWGKCKCRTSYENLKDSYDNECYNGGRCDDSSGLPKCKCLHGYYGEQCEKQNYNERPCKS